MPSAANNNEAIADGLDSLLHKEQIQQYQTKLNENFTSPSIADVETFSNALHILQAYLKQPETEYLMQAKRILATLDYRLETVNNGRYVFLHEKTAASRLGSLSYRYPKHIGTRLGSPCPLG